MKRQLSYEELKGLARSVAQQLRERHPQAVKDNKLFLYAVVRGGLSFAQLVSYYMALPLGMIYPMPGGHGIRQIHPFNEDLTEDAAAVFVYLEDVVARGRTLEKIMRYHNVHYGAYFKAEFVPAVLDANLPGEIMSLVNIKGMVTSDWIVFPHEDFQHVTEGDRGLFRDGTSNNSTTIL